jgi:hypothetical protein
VDIPGFAAGIVGLERNKKKKKKKTHTHTTYIPLAEADIPAVAGLVAQSPDSAEVLVLLCYGTPSYGEG